MRLDSDGLISLTHNCAGDFGKTTYSQYVPSLIDPFPSPPLLFLCKIKTCARIHSTVSPELHLFSLIRMCLNLCADCYQFGCTSRVFFFARDEIFGHIWGGGGCSVLWVGFTSVLTAQVNEQQGEPMGRMEG